MSFAGESLLRLSDRERRRIAGKDVAMIFQEPTSSLNPCFTIGFQIGETLQVHEGGSTARRGASAPSSCWSRSASRRRRPGFRRIRTSFPAA